MSRPNNTTLLPSPLVLPLLLLLISLLQFTSTAAEKQVQYQVDQTIKAGRLSNALFGTIHGSGSIDFAKLNYDFDNGEGTISAAGIMLPNKKEMVKLQKWQADDTASSRARLQEYLVDQGLGATGKDGVYYACCTHAAVAAQACNQSWNYDWFHPEVQDQHFNLSQTGNLIVTGNEETRFRSLDINGTGDLGMHGVMWFGETRLVALFFANCNASSSTTETVHIHGTTVWTSYVSASTLPLYLFLMLCHGGLTLWYRELMNQNKDSRIQVEEWIFFTLFLATVAIAIKTIYYATEAFADDEWTRLSFASEFSKSIVRACSRCLYLLLAMGVGVTCSKLENPKTMLLIGLFLGVYILCDLVEDLTILGIVVPFFMSTIYLLLTLSLVFMIWIPVALCKTMKLLEFRNETMKLQRYKMIFRIYLLAILLGILEFVFFIVDMQVNAGRDYDFMTQGEQEDITYLIILGCMAMLWKPNPSQQIYAYQLLGDDGDMTPPTNMSLELSEGAFVGNGASPVVASMEEHDLELS